MNVGVIVFPGSNCDHDCQHVFQAVLGQSVRMIWHKETSLAGVDAVILPGGFSYGDYLRTGAIARFSPVMGAVKAFAKDGGAVIGICNGFQILCEAGLLPGVLMRNANLRFICHDVTLRVETTRTPFTSAYRKGEVVRFPVAHGDGNYRCDAETLRRLKGEDRVAFRYVDAAGETTAAGNPNGSLDAIAGIVNDKRNVLGLMPHPEDMIEPAHGGTDGRRLFAGLVEAVVA